MIKIDASSYVNSFSMSPNLSTTVNRNLILLVPRQPALDWLFSIEPQLIQEMTLDSLRQEQDAYLVTEDKFKSIEAAQQWVDRHWNKFFSQFLSTWYLDESLWPKARTLKMFRDWFEVQYHSMVWDLSLDPLIRDPQD